MVAWRYEISLLVLKKYFTRSLRSLVKYFSTLEEKFRVPARPCISAIHCQAQLAQARNVSIGEKSSLVHSCFFFFFFLKTAAY